MKYTGERIVLESPECAPDTVIFREHAERYKFASRFVKGKRVLDIACGVGYGSEILHSMGQPQSIIGGDISDEAVAYATQKYAGLTNVRFERMNAEAIALDQESVDVVVSFETIEHLPHVADYLNSINKVLAKGGVYIVSTPNRLVTHTEATTVENPFHHHEFTIDELSTLLKKHFTIREVYYQRPYTPNVMTSAVGRISKWESVYRKVIPRFIRVDLRNRFWPDISTDVGIYPYKEPIRPLYFVFVCVKV